MSGCSKYEPAKGMNSHGLFIFAYLNNYCCMKAESVTIEKMLSGGHPNSLGRTLEVVEIVLNDQNRLEELYQCYFSSDEVVRLRTSNAMKRICKEHPDCLAPYLTRLLTEISAIEQASTQWTLAQLFAMLDAYMTDTQLEYAKGLLRHNLLTHRDWIVLNMTMETLGKWARQDEELRTWLWPELERLQMDNRKSVSNKASKLLKAGKS